MLPLIALVGRPNVGKSTLFNRLTRSREALVANLPGLTRDRKYGRANIADMPVNLVDTAGLLGSEEGVSDSMHNQALVAVAEADHVLFLVDARIGLHPHDHEVAALLRRGGKPVTLVVNKTDGVAADGLTGEFAELGFDMQLISASHGRGVGVLCTVLVETLAKQAASTNATDLPGDSRGTSTDEASSSIVDRTPELVPRVAIIGRPNVGKSTLVNRLLGEERQVVFDQPGTTRDAIDIPFVRDDTHYVLIDTAGVRRKGRVTEVVEKFSVVKTLDAMDRAAVVVLVLDAHEDIVDQDLHMLKYAVDAGCGIVLAVNKWDGLDPDHRAHVKRNMDRKLRFAEWCPQVFISALHGTGVGHLFREVDRIYSAGSFDVTTSLLTRLMTDMVRNHPTPSIRGRAIKLRFAHKQGEHPPKIVIHGNQTEHLPPSYVRYLENGFREALDLYGTPVKIEFKTSDNPFAGRRNELTQRQKVRRQRVIQHRKKRKN